MKRDEHFLKRNNDGLLNLKTPSGGGGGRNVARGQQQQQQQQQQDVPRHHQLQPHPSWVYRANYALFDPDGGGRDDVGGGGAVGGGVVGAAAHRIKRSLSFLQRSEQGGGDKQQAFLDQRRIDLVSHTAGGRTIKKMTVTGAVQEARLIQDLPAPIHGGSNTLPGKMRHAVIRRHQSMYIHPRAQSSNAEMAQVRPAAYRLQEVSGKSEVRPIVTLQRSNTTAASMHYRYAINS